MGKQQNSNYKRTSSSTRPRKPGKGKPAPYPKQDAASSKQDRREEELSNTGAAMSRSNPIEFYNKFSSYSRDAATLPFSLPVGEFVSADIKLYDQLFSNVKMSAPGLMRLQFVPSIGVSNDFTSPINQTSIKFWTYLRSIQKAAANYDHQDITMMILALDNVIMFHSLLRRVYGLLGDYTPTNLYYPKTLVEACGFDYNDLKDNISDFRMYINQIAYNIQQYTLPKGIELFKRHQWMCEGVYTDGQGAHAQTYIFVPQCFYVYDNTVESGSQLTPTAWLTAGTDRKKFAEVVEFGNDMINAISNDEDFAFISGDMNSFFGGDSFVLPYTDEAYKILPVYDETVLSQIENATIMGGIQQAAITQNPAVNQGAIIYQPKCSVYDHFTRKDAVMNFHHDSPTPDQVIEATRLITTVDITGDVSQPVPIVNCGTEIIYEVDIYSRNPLTGLFRYNPIKDFAQYFNASTTPDQLGSIIQDLVLLASFDWAPRIDLWNVTGHTELDSAVAIGTSWDIDNMQQIPSNYLTQIQRACLMSLFVVGSY